MNTRIEVREEEERALPFVLAAVRAHREIHGPDRFATRAEAEAAIPEFRAAVREAFRT
jgi:hypothetical protein